MANATAITVNQCVENGTVAITEDLVTNGTVALTLAASLAAATGSVDRAILMVENDNTVASQTLTVAVLGNTTLPALYGTPASITKSAIATGAVVGVGPFDVQRHDNNGTLSVTFTPASGGTLKFRTRLMLLPQ